MSSRYWNETDILPTTWELRIRRRGVDHIAGVHLRVLVRAPMGFINPSARGAPQTYDGGKVEISHQRGMEARSGLVPGARLRGITDAVFVRAFFIGGQADVGDFGARENIGLPRQVGNGSFNRGALGVLFRAQEAESAA